MNTPAAPRLIQHAVLHRLEFEQEGQIPDIVCLAKAHVQAGGQVSYTRTWMDEQDVGHLYFIWQEGPQMPGMEKTPAQRPSRRKKE